MANITCIAGPSQSKKRKVNEKLTDDKILQLPEKSDLSDYDTSNDEDYDWNSESESEGDSDVPVDTIEISDSDTEDAIQQFPAIGKNSLVDWKTDSSCMISHTFTKTESLLIQPTESTPVGYFRLLLTEGFLKKIVEKTNRYALEIQRSDGTKEKSRITSWKDLRVDEFLVFLGAFLQMGNVRMNRLQDYWKKDPLFHNAGIANSISLNRFLLISRALHFAKNSGHGEPQPTDRLYEIRPVIDFFNERMCEIYYPDRELYLDESMVLWRGRFLFRQYIKNKKHKYGIKLYSLSTSNEIQHKLVVHTGLLDDYGGQKHTQKIVLSLLNEKLNAGHHVFMESYYNSFDLAKLLLDKKTHCTGTLKANHKNSPKDVQTTKLRKGDTIERYCQGVMIGKWID
ncbi:piggyBac transposable element-derived protein 4 [Trichonephila clavipes]|nr:piggyBac transposable element-derived protein 4 [Trichonephila clavipes]